MTGPRNVAGASLSRSDGFVVLLFVAALTTGVLSILATLSQ